MTDLQGWLRKAAELEASDVHLTMGERPLVRVRGRLQPLADAVLSKEQVVQFLGVLLRPPELGSFKDGSDVDTAYSSPSGLRFRVNVYRHTRGAAVALRLIPSRIPTFQDLGLPEELKTICMKASGLILVTGPTGSGKSTSLATMLEHINQQLSGHVITIEDPVEFLFKSRKCLIHQREVGRHTRDFAGALRSALREDPDIIMVGEMRDLETMRLALQAAETGHMVLATLHTRGAPQTLDRVSSVFPTQEQPMVRQMLADSLSAVLCQALLPRADQTGRVAAFELLVATGAVRNLIREGKLHQIPSVIQTGMQMGMVSLDQSLRRLVASRTIDKQEARRVSLNPSLFK